MSHEHQMAYQTSQSRGVPVGDALLIKRVREDGLFAVVEHAPNYCRHTDALLPGVTRYLRGAYTTRQEAAERCALAADTPGNESAYSVEEPTFKPGFDPRLGAPYERFARGYEQALTDRREKGHDPKVLLAPTKDGGFVMQDRDAFHFDGYERGLVATAAPEITGPVPGVEEAWHLYQRDWASEYALLAIDSHDAWAAAVWIAPFMHE
jgi:hypothetical protein